MTESVKFTHFMDFLSGKALTWPTALWQGGEHHFPYEQFLQMFRQVFDHSPAGKEISELLLSMSQGQKSAAEYVLDFRTLSSKSGWN